MKFLATILVFGGYALVYASVAAGGKFATEPWLGLVQDAYVGNLYPGQTPGYFNTPQGTAPYKPPPGIPTTP